MTVDGCSEHRAGSAELGCPDGEHGLIEIEILELQVEGFGNAQTRDAEQTQKAMKDPRPQRCRRPPRRHLQERRPTNDPHLDRSTSRVGLRVVRYGISAAAGISVSGSVALR